MTRIALIPLVLLHLVLGASFVCAQSSTAPTLRPANQPLRASGSSQNGAAAEEPEIDESDVVRVNQQASFGPVVRAKDVKIVQLQELIHNLADLEIVVDDEHCAPVAHALHFL